MKSNIYLFLDSTRYEFLFFSYNSAFFKLLIGAGAKIRAFNLFVQLKYKLKVEEDFDPYIIFLVSMMKISPQFTLSALKLSGVVYWVPIPIFLRKKITLSIKWVIALIRKIDANKRLEALVKAMTNSIYNKGILMVEKKNFYSKGLVNRHLLKFFS